MKLMVAGAALMACVLSTPQAAAVVALSHPGSTNSGYTSPVFVHANGQILTYVNFDVDVHDIRSDDRRPSGSAGYCVLFPTGACPLFYSDTLELGQSGPVYGSDLIGRGLYGFYCSWHPWMTGMLLVEG